MPCDYLSRRSFVHKIGALHTQYSLTQPQLPGVQSQPLPSTSISFPKLIFTQLHASRVMGPLRLVRFSCFPCITYEFYSSNVSFMTFLCFSPPSFTLFLPNYFILPSPLLSALFHILNLFSFFLFFIYSGSKKCPNVCMIWKDQIGVILLT
jgi:hypothetical protein